MSVPPRRSLPARPSLEQLRKQAKEHLDTLRAADPSVNLAAAQHARAREYGFDTWPKLVHHIESMQPENRVPRVRQDRSAVRMSWLGVRDDSRNWLIRSAYRTISAVTNESLASDEAV